MVMEILLGKNIEELQEVALSVGLPRFAGKQLADWLYQKRVTTFDEMTNISKKGREALAEHYSIGRHLPVREAVSKDGTRKYLFEASLPSLRDTLSPKGEREFTTQYIECVYIPDGDRATLCVSTQAGCKMGCRFCMTGTLGFHGQLSAGEILNQIFTVDALNRGNAFQAEETPSRLRKNDDGRGEALTNVVYMGEGEPMDNIDNVLRSLEIMTATYGAAWSPKRITVSTVGVPAGLRRFLDESECHLAISLHNPFPVERAAIMPAEKLCSIEEVLRILREYDWSHQRRVSFEYICWGMQNTGQAYGKQLVKLLNGLDCRINLIRFHKTDNTPCPSTGKGVGERGSFPASDEQQMGWLQDYLNAHDITTTIRRSRGEDILAACGMLVNSLKN